LDSRVSAVTASPVVFPPMAACSLNAWRSSALISPRAFNHTRRIGAPMDSPANSLCGASLRYPLNHKAPESRYRRSLLPAAAAIAAPRHTSHAVQLGG